MAFQSTLVSARAKRRTHQLPSSNPAEAQDICWNFTNFLIFLDYFIVSKQRYERNENVEDFVDFYKFHLHSKW